jgi:hypothetical protein
VQNALTWGYDPAMSDTDYDTDVVRWSERQAALLRERAAGKLVNEADLDWANLVEEIESVGINQEREVRRRLARICQHLLKWAFQPELQSRSWRATIAIQRRELKDVVKDSTSLKPFVAEVLEDAYQLARIWAENETGLMRLPDEKCPWTAEQVQDDDFILRYPSFDTASC